MNGVKADIGTTTAVVARTRVAATVGLVLTARTIVDTVAPQEDRQTKAVVRTLEVGAWTRGGQVSYSDTVSSF